MVETDDTIRAWLEVKKKKRTLLYDFGSRRYGNTTMNFSKVFNNI
jgi:hypothetical protein